MTKEEKERKKIEEYKKEIHEYKEKNASFWKSKVQWSISYLIYFSIFLILLIATFILIFTLGNKGIYFVPIVALLFFSWAGFYLFFMMKNCYITIDWWEYIVSVLIPIGGFIIGVFIAIKLLQFYKDWQNDELIV